MFSRELIDDILLYVEKIEVMIEKVRNAISLLNDARIDEAQRELAIAVKLDTEADNQRRKLAERRLEKVDDVDTWRKLLDLLRLLDRVSEWSKEAARYLNVVSFSKTPEMLRSRIEELAQLGLEGIRGIAKALHYIAEGRIDEALAECRRVEKLEELADDVTYRARKELVAFGERIENPATIVLLRDFIEALENVTDYEEDVSDVIRILSMKIGRQR